MEFIKTKIYASQIDVLFTGKYYAFHSGWYGWVVIAERDYEFEYANEGKTRFTIKVDKSNELGGSWNEFVTMAKKVITKNENKYIKQEVLYEVEDAPVYKWKVNVNIVE